MRVIRNPTFRTDLLRANEWVFAQCEERRRRTQPRLPISRLQYGASCEPRRHGDRCRVHHERISALVWVQLVVFRPSSSWELGLILGICESDQKPWALDKLILPDFRQFQHVLAGTSCAGRVCGELSSQCQTWLLAVHGAHEL